MQLEGLPPKLRQAYLEGDWNLFEGQFFNEWRDDMHVVEPFKIPSTWRLFGAYDHGRSKPACFKWYAIDYDGNVWVYRELYVNKEDGSARWEAEHIAREALRITTEAGERLEYVVADAAIFSQTGHGETIAEIFMKNGVGKSVGKVEWNDLNGHHEMPAGAIPLLIPSHKDRLAGWAIMHQYLAWSEDSLPKMRYFSICRDSIRTTPALVYNDPTKIQSDRRLEDLNTTGEDHAADTDRYFLQTIRSKKTPAQLTVEQKKSTDFKKRLGISNDDPLQLSRFDV
jgi:hypothetical protein